MLSIAVLWACCAALYTYCSAVSSASRTSQRGKPVHRAHWGGGGGGDLHRGYYVRHVITDLKAPRPLYICGELRIATSFAAFGPVVIIRGNFALIYDK